MIHEIMQLTNTRHNPSFAGDADNDLSLLSRYHFQGCNVPQPVAAACLSHAHSMEVYQPSPIQVNFEKLYTNKISVFR